MSGQRRTSVTQTVVDIAAYRVQRMAEQRAQRKRRSATQQRLDLGPVRRVEVIRPEPSRQIYGDGRSVLEGE